MTTFAFLFEMPHFSNFQNNIGKIGYFKYFSIDKGGISNKKHITSFKTKNEPKMKFFDFGAFQIKMQMSSQDKIVLHMLFGAFHITPRMLIDSFSKRRTVKLQMTFKDV